MDNNLIILIIMVQLINYWFNNEYYRTLSICDENTGTIPAKKLNMSTKSSDTYSKWKFS